MKNFSILILFIVMLVLVGCENEVSSGDSEVKTFQSEQGLLEKKEEDCDDPQKQKIEIQDGEINLLDQSEGCKLPD